MLAGLVVDSGEGDGADDVQTARAEVPVEAGPEIAADVDRDRVLDTNGQLLAPTDPTYTPAEQVSHHERPTPDP